MHPCYSLNTEIQFVVVAASSTWVKKGLGQKTEAQRKIIGSPLPQSWAKDIIKTGLVRRPGEKI